MNRILSIIALAVLLFAPVAEAQVIAPIPVKLTALLAAAQTIKSTKGVLQWMSCYNPNAAIAFVQIFDAAAPTVGTTPAALSVVVPATSSVSIPIPSQYFTAITTAATTTVGGNTALGAALNCNFGIN